MYLALCLFLVFLSGFTGLVYQVTWQKYLSHHLGSHALAATLVLSTFFLWLSIGYFVIGRSAHRLVRNKLLLYGILEGLIGVWCLASPQIFRGLAALFSFHVANPSLELAADLLFATLFIGPPTFLMGGTIPVLTDALTVEYEASHRTHALIYGTNTAGAFLGTLLAGFVLLERLGLPGTLVVTSSVNLALFAATLAITRVSRRSETILAPAPERGEALAPGVRFALLAQSFLSGFYVFSLENLLIRMAGISLGSSTYTYSIIVASFVLAIALGSLAVSAFRRIAGFRFFLAVQALLFASVVLLYLSVPGWPALFLRTRSLFHPALMNHGYYWAAVLAVFVVLLLVPVGLIGMNLPLLFNYLRSRSQYLSQAVGQVYAVNSVGSALGAVIGGYWLFHFADGDQVFKLSLALVLLSLPLLIWIYAGRSRRRRAAALLPLFLAPAILALPAWDQRSFVPGLFMFPAPRGEVADFGTDLAHVRKRINEQNRILWTRYDPNTIVHVVDDLAGRALYVNGKPDSHTAIDRTTRTLTALIPLSVAPRIERVFIIGLGGGLSTSVAAGFDEVRKVVVAEISQGVIDALPMFTQANLGLEQERGKVEIVRGDAYKVLLRDPRRYDLIVCEPSSLWVTGVEKLFTVDFYEQARERLTPEGIYAQWFNTGPLDGDTFRTILASFSSAFPWTTVWSAGGGSLTLLGSQRAPQVDFEKVAARFQERRALYESIALRHPLGILGNQLLPPSTVARLVAGHEEVHSLEQPVLVYRSGRALFAAIQTDLESLVEGALADPLPVGDESSRFLLDAHRGPLPEEFFASTRAFAENIPVFSFARQRLSWLHALAYPQSPQREIPTDALRRGTFLLTDSAEAGGRAELPALIDTWRTLKNAQLPARTEKLTALIEAACARGDCSELQFRMLRTRLSDAELRERGVVPAGNPAQLPDTARARVAQLYAELFAAPVH